MTLTITKRDGTKEPFNADKINRSIERACHGLMDPIRMVTQIATETRLTLYDGITTEEMDQATINAAVQNIKEDIEYDKVAVRLLLKTIYRKVVGEYNDNMPRIRSETPRRNSRCRSRHASATEFSIRAWQKSSISKASPTALDIDRDELFVYAASRHCSTATRCSDENQKRIETPQYFFMRIAMGLSYNEKNPTAAAKRSTKMSQAPIHRRRLDESRRGHDAPGALQLFPSADPGRHGAHREVRRRRHDALQSVGRHRRLDHEAARDRLSAQIVQQPFHRARRRLQRSSTLRSAQSSAAARRTARSASTWRTGTSTSPNSSTGSTTPATTTSACAPPTPRCSSPTNS